MADGLKVVDGTEVAPLDETAGVAVGLHPASMVMNMTIQKIDNNSFLICFYPHLSIYELIE
jgi:hypothetical protein